MKSYKIIYTLCKFGGLEHLEDFRNGNLHMNSTKYFSNLNKTDIVRSDKYEDTDKMFQPKDILSLDIKVDINDITKNITIPSKDFVGPITIGFGNIYNTFCMYIVKMKVPSNFEEIINLSRLDNRNYKFGNSCIFILNPQEFINRILSAAEKQNLNVSMNKIKYIDNKSYSGDIGLFRKIKKFKYQKEYRIAVYPGKLDAITLSIGDLTDITSNVCPIAAFNAATVKLNPL